MFTNLQNANIKINSWLLKESKMCVFSKEGMKNEDTFYEEKRSKSDLQLAVPGWKNKWVQKVIKRFYENRTPREEFCV